MQLMRSYMKYWKAKVYIMNQLEFYQESKEEKLERKLEELYLQYEKIRKGQYAKISSLNKTINDLSSRMEIYDRYFCRGHENSQPLQLNLPFIDS